MFWKRFQDLCDNAKKSPNAVTKELGFSAATATSWKNGAIPNGAALQKLADYFTVSVDYLLGRTDDPTGKLKVQVGSYDNPLGQPITDEERAMLQAVLEAYRKQQSDKK